MDEELRQVVDRYFDALRSERTPETLIRQADAYVPLHGFVDEGHQLVGYRRRNGWRNIVTIDLPHDGPL